MDTAAEKVMVFVDGSNFYHGLKATIGTAAINFPQFSRRLVGSSRTLVRTYYYNAPIPQLPDQERYKAQQRFAVHPVKLDVFRPGIREPPPFDD